MMLSVIIPTRNRRASLEQTLAALQTQEQAPRFEIIVIDNGSTDTTATLLAEASTRLPLRSFHEEQPHRGRARNRGIAEATGDLAVFIDDDVIVPPHFLAAHAKTHSDPTNSAVVTGPILNIAAAQERPQPSWYHSSRAFFCTCNASVSLSALRQVGGFDEAFHAYGWEDTELGVRLRKAGLHHRFAWDAYVYHLKPPGWESLHAAAQRTREKARMALLFASKHPQLRVRLATGDYALNRWRSALWSAPAIQPGLVALSENPRVPQFVRAFARQQYLDGLYLAELARRPS